MPLDETTTPSSPSLVDQYRLEQEMLDGGVARFLRKEQKDAAVGIPGQTGKWLIRRLMAPVAQALKAEITSTAVGRRAASLPYIEDCGPEVASYLALRAILGAISMSDTGAVRCTEACVRVGRSLENELWMRKVMAEKPDLFDLTMNEVSEYRDPRVRGKVARIMARKGGVEAEWNERTRFLVGSKLVETIREVTGIVEMPMVREGKQTVRYLSLSADTKEKLEEVRDMLSSMSPALMPCIIPPKPWTSTRDGGYHSGLFRRLNLIKTWSGELVEELDNMDMSQVLAAVNSIQNTAWRVNLRVLEVLEEAIASEQGIGKLPSRLEEVPPFPEDRKHDLETVKRWKRAAAKVHTKNRKNIGKRLQVAQVAATARRFVGKSIWFPHQMDFRGRIYAMPIGLNPQGPDYAKALLTFAKGYPILDNRALGWLMITGANRYGVDKCSLVDRIAWVEQNEEAVMAVAEDPWGPAYDFWTKADEPFQFLAWCCDYAGFKGHGWGYERSLPVGLDGSCNGLQHYSAALRDPEGGRAVNLIGKDVPSDIYGIVADRALTKVKDFLRPEGPDTGTIPNLAQARDLWARKEIDERAMARAWLTFGLDRKVTKRAVMTLPYGATQYSARDFIEDAIAERLEKGVANPFYQGEDPVEARNALFRASLWLQPLVWSAIGETVKAARVGMDWLQACARVVCAQGLPVTWKTPDGFVVQQAYRAWENHRVKTVLDGAVARTDVVELGVEVDRRAQSQGIAPNWVHSMDACALRMFVNIATENGLEDFALVHDSYGTQAAKVDLMVGCLKESFIALYGDHDPILNFYFDVLDQLPDDKALRALPKPPSKGDLKLADIRSSDYFFA